MIGAWGAACQFKEWLGLRRRPVLRRTMGVDYERARIGIGCAKQRIGLLNASKNIGVIGDFRADVRKVLFKIAR
jgi:hypothetical protein